MTMFDPIELRQLDHVVKICRAGSFSEAARRLRLSQPALSKSVSRLEAQLGVRLFRRDGGGAAPTEAGLLLAERANKLLANSDAMVREIAHLASRPTQRLRIGVGPATRLKPLPGVLKGLLSQFPELRVEVRQDDGRSIIRGVEEGRFDIAFGASENAATFGDLIRVTMFEDRMAVVARPGHPATRIDHPLSADELLRHPMASVGLTEGFRDWIAGVGEAEMRNATALVCDDLELIQACAPPTHTLRGVSFIFERALEAGELVEVRTAWGADYHCWMLTTEDNWRLPLIKAVADIGRASVARAPRRNQAC